MDELEYLKEQLCDLIDDVNVDGVKLDPNPWCDYYAETDCFHIGTIQEDECNGVRKYDAYIPFDQVIDTFISDCSSGVGIAQRDHKYAIDFISKLRAAANKIESKLQQVKGSK